MVSIEELQEKVKRFNIDRDWDQFHNPKDLLIALVSEVGELADCYRWLNDEEMKRIHSDPTKKKDIEEELADITMYILTLAYKTNIDLVQAIEQKLEKNAKKYPLEKSKGVHSNYIEGFKGKS